MRLFYAVAILFGCVGGLSGMLGYGLLGLGAKAKQESENAVDLK